MDQASANTVNLQPAGVKRGAKPVPVRLRHVGRGFVMPPSAHTTHIHISAVLPQVVYGDIDYVRATVRRPGEDAPPH
jgi:hypothetical protein